VESERGEGYGRSCGGELNCETFQVVQIALADGGLVAGMALLGVARVLHGGNFSFNDRHVCMEFF
jgi:hypothetical protein